MSGPYFPGVAEARRRSVVRRLVVVAVLLVVLVLTGLLWPKAERGGLRVATVAGSVAPSGVLHGALDATRHGDTACYSLTVRGTTSVLRFVDGWSAQEGLGLVDPAGSVIAQPGARVILLGRPSTSGSVAGCTERGRIWTITSAELPTP